MALVQINPNQKTDYSNEYYCIHSVQKLNSKYDTNVLASNIPISQLLKNRDILLVDDLKGDARWGMNKIIQRNISDKRVNEIKSEYLETLNRSIKFFPAITVILLPKSQGEPIPNFNNSKDNFDNIAGINVSKTYQSEHYLMDHPVILNWDKSKISALIIDGQHRVSAIRNYYDLKNENTYKDISIPVSFVIFKNDPNLDLIQATRALFIDVNNTPRLVSEEKLIFIDDRNIHRRITAKTLGANDPEDDKEDIYQKMLIADDFLISNKNFINRYLIEESGKDDEERRGFLSNHNTLFPWEISNIMTVHRNILGGILLRYNDIDKTRDIRSICFQLNSTILEEIEGSEAIKELEGSNKNYLIDRLSKGGLIDSEIAIFENLIYIKKKSLEEIQEAEGQFYAGTVADVQEEKDKDYFLGLLQNIYNQDCTKDVAFELSSTLVSEILKEKCSTYINLLTKVFNGLWFTEIIKNSILNYKGEERQLIFDFILTTHESLKINSDRRRSNKVSKQINEFLKETTKNKQSKTKLLLAWAEELEKTQNPIILRSVVGQEMLFHFILSQNTKLNTIDYDQVLGLINSLGEAEFFNKNIELTLKFFNDERFKILNFNHWSEIIMKGERMKPGTTNAMKGSYLISILKDKISNRNNAGGKLRILDRIQKSYGLEIINKLTEKDNNIIFEMYTNAKNAPNLDKFLNQNEIDVISEEFGQEEDLPKRVVSVVSKLFGAYALEQVVMYFNEKIENL